MSVGKSSIKRASAATKKKTPVEKPVEEAVEVNAVEETIEKEVVVRYEDIDEHYELYDKSQGYDYSILDLEEHIDNTNRIESALSNASDITKEWCKKYADGMTFEQIAREYGKTKHAVRQAIKRLAE